MRKQIAEQNGVIQQLLKFMPMVQMNQNTPANVSVMQQNKAQGCGIGTLIFLFYV